ncbi:transcriptional regulator GcvA [Mesorhizobium sp. RP14(2022)]|uniref:Transcriptional regulator GcvA n=1 Tax=Mesorhizobium liriopis TaxID=2953882 RepID=A0ABT1C919_9HYPH|nr:transcriptional regulator GcvA [Mesorhizobium liriopis]MCO6051163.1 transcriptional regulator GcvA [Mesorhizobium liriopis]
MASFVPGTRALRVFDAAARHLNFTRAADEVGLTPAAVSHQIKEMEEQLGAVLFARTSRTIRLTEAGVLFRDAAAESLALLDHAALRLRKLQRTASQLTLSLDANFATKWMLPRVDEFRAEHPEIDLRFDISHALRDFSRDEVDAAVRFGKGHYPGLVSLRLFDNIIVPVCSPALLKGPKPLREPRDLLNHMLVHIEWSGQGITWPNWRSWMAAAGVSGFDNSRSLVFEDTAHAVQAAIAGQVVALADLAMVADDLAAGRLVRPFELGIKLPEEFGYFFVYPESSAGDVRIEALRDWVLKGFGKF